MARNPNFLKRQKERARQEKKAQKAQRRAERREQRDDLPRPAGGEDPDIAGIVPGPQPPIWERLEEEAGPEGDEADEDLEERD